MDAQSGELQEEGVRVTSEGIDDSEMHKDPLTARVRHHCAAVINND